MQLSQSRARKVFKLLLDFLRDLYQKCSLVHSDFSAYNVLMHRKQPVVIDFAQAVDHKSHPKANEYLERDCRNLMSHFEQYEVEPMTDAEMVAYVKTEEELQ